ncbi:glycosyltransferase [Streptococcus equinus]|uniref:glycosyltransferase family 4 protein n=1 Tax=Streptococcus equinus TaxID=1335 RepID=UPI0010700E2B|nr:glycosyltransferase family 4 protein [Streptococcus equinus]TFH44937.1 glycosyltransferase [Streptococcus equinus]
MKIGFISEFDLADKKAWSGTISFLSETLSKDYDVYPIVVKGSAVQTFLKKFIKFISLKHWNYTIIDKFIYGIKVNNRLKQAVKSGVKVFFAPAASRLLGNANIPDGCKVIYLSDTTYHLMLDYYFFGVSKNDKKHFNKSEQDALDRATDIIYSSDWAKKDAISYYGVNEDKIHVLPFGGNLRDEYYPKKALDKKNIKILFVGVDWERKGTDIAIDCVNKLNQLETDFHFELNIIGLEEPKDRSFGDDIRFIGKLNKNNNDEFKKMINYYQTSDIFLLPTKAECAGIVFSEASMYGLPIFTHNTGGVMTYVDEGRTGRGLKLGSTSEDFAKAILQMIKDDNYLEWSLNAREKYEKELNWDKWYHDFKTIVESYR